VEVKEVLWYMIQEDYGSQIVRRMRGPVSGVKYCILVHLLDHLTMIEVLCAVMQWLVGFETCA